jgi:DNA-binding GntR family transcriptional regulator
MEPDVDSQSYSDMAVTMKPDQRLSEQACDRLRDAIVRGMFAPGARLLERQLTDWLQVSRTPIREALRKLEDEGLVVNYPHRGYFVRNPSFEEAKQAYEMRAILETASCELAAERATEVDVASLRQAVRRSNEALEAGDREELLQRNKEVHRRLVRAAHNAFLEKQWESIWAFADLLRGSWWVHTERPEVGHREHEELVEAIASGDAELAHRLGEEHSRKAWDNVARRFQSSQD